MASICDGDSGTANQVFFWSTYQSIFSITGCFTHDLDCDYYMGPSFGHMSGCYTWQTGSNAGDTNQTSLYCEGAWVDEVHDCYFRGDGYALYGIRAIGDGHVSLYHDVTVYNLVATKVGTGILINYDSHVTNTNATTVIQGWDTGTYGKNYGGFYYVVQPTFVGNTTDHSGVYQAA